MEQMDLLDLTEGEKLQIINLGPSELVLLVVVS